MVVYYDELEYKKQSSGIFSEKKIVTNPSGISGGAAGSSKNSKIFGGG